MSLVSSASGARAPGGGILINRSRPSSPQPPTSRSLSYEAEPLSTSIGSSSGASLTDRTGRPLPPIRTHSSTSSTTNLDEPLTPSSPGFIVNPQSFHPTTTGLLVREDSIERKKPKIKFAPLPQIRPRSYSTGRNVWAEHDPEDFEGDGGGFGGEFVLEDGAAGGGPLGGRHLVRREDGKIIPFDEDDNPLYDDDDDYDEDDNERSGGGFKFNPRRQSWTDSLGMGSVWGSNSNVHKRDKSRDIDEDAVSLGSSAGGGNNSDYGLSSSGGKEKESGGVSKILKPFLFGRKKSIKSSHKVSPSVDEVGNGGVGLSRQSSGESQISRKSSIDNNATRGPPTPTNEGTSRSKGSTGIPMRKASTWDSTNSAGSKGSNSTTTKKNSNRNSASLPRDPSTPQIIYYASPSRSSRPTRRAQYPPVAQRSRTAPKAIRQTKVEEPEFSEWGSVGSVGSVGSKTAKSAGDDDEDGSGMAWIRRRRKEREEKEKKERELALAQAATNSTKGQDAEQDTPVEMGESEKGQEEDKENEVVQRAIGRNPKRQSTVDSTFSMTSSTSTIRPSSPKIMSGLSLSRPVETREPVELGQDSPEPDSEEEDQAGEDASEDEEEEEEEVEEQEEDDLDAEELAKEEALCDAARRTANCAGAERFHSTTHENVLHVPSDPIKRQPSQNLKRSNSNGSQIA